MNGAKNLGIMEALKAAEVLKKHWDQLVPVNPIKMANALGVNVYYNDTIEHMGEFFYKNSKPSIVYKPSGDIITDRFVIAHELGHFCMEHGPAHKDSSANFLSSTDNIIEASANNFAKFLLIPPKKLDVAVKISPIDTVKGLANAFGVSENLMIQRLREARYIR